MPAAGPPLAFASIEELATLIANRQLSAAELLANFVRRIDQLDGKLRCYVTLTVSDAAAQARRADRSLARGEEAGALRGIPVALKDNLDVAGVATTANSRSRQHMIATRDSWVAYRLKASGAVLLGKLNLHEMAMGPPEADLMFQPPPNPWHPRHTVGGSSSGSAVAILGGLCAGSFGSDTGGSIRTPAAFVGVCGFKPSFGLVPARGLVPLAPTLDHVGPLARSVADLAILLSSVARSDRRDARTGQPIARAAAAVPQRDARRDAPRLKLGIPRQLRNGRLPGLEPEVSQAFDSAVRTLVRLGHVERTVDLPDLPTLDAALTCIMTVEAIAAHGDLLQRSPGSFGRGFRKAVAPGYLFTALDKLRADEVRGRLRANLREAWRSVDIILTPTLPWVAPHVGSRSVPPRGPFTGLANLAGNPSLTVPCGLGKENLPVGLMLSGRVSDDVTVLAIGDEYQSVTSWHTRSPFIASQPRSDELPEVRVEGVAQPVSEQIERQDDRGNR